MTPREGRKFGLTVGLAFLLLGSVAFWRDHPVAATVLGTAAAIFLGGGLLLPARMGPLQDAWMALARAISKVTTPIVMGLIYFLVITPMGLLRRNLGRHPLRHRDREGGYWTARSAPGGDLERQF